MWSASFFDDVLPRFLCDTGEGAKKLDNLRRWVSSICWGGQRGVSGYFLPGKSDVHVALLLSGLRMGK